MQYVNRAYCNKQREDVNDYRLIDPLLKLFYAQHIFFLSSILGVFMIGLIISFLISLALIFILIFPNFMLINIFRNYLSARVAKYFGDRGPERAGFLSLDPRNHIDLKSYFLFILCMLAVNVVFGAGAGWSVAMLFIMMTMGGARKTFTIDASHYQNYPTGPLLTLLARPFASLLYCFLVLLIMRFIPINLSLISNPNAWQYFVWQALDNGATYGAYFTVFSMLPFPQQTSGQIIEMLMTDEQKEEHDWFFTYGDIALIGLILMPGINDIFFKTMYGMAFGIKTMLNTGIVFVAKYFQL